MTQTDISRVALVTGGSRGIGRGIALRLAADGFAVAVNYRRDADAAEEVCRLVREKGGEARAYQASVDVEAETAAMAEQVLADLGRVDVLVSNAGIASRGRLVVDTGLDELDRLLATHVRGAFHLCQLLLPQMRTLGRGDVVFVSSIGSRRPNPGGAPYMMAKAAEEALAATLAKEEMPHGIRVNTVAPGLVVTDMGDRLTRAVAGLEGAEALDARAPYGRVCRPEDVAAVVSFLVSEDGSYVNGQRIEVDGGGDPFTGR